MRGRTVRRTAAAAGLALLWPPAIGAAAGPRPDLRGLRLTISSPQKRVLVGEPVKINVVWEAVGPVRRVWIENEGFRYRSLGLVVKRGRHRFLYRESMRPSEIETMLVSSGLSAGERLPRDYVFFTGQSFPKVGMPPVGRFLFPSAGKYLVTAVYLLVGPTMSDVRPTFVASNRLRFKVAEPTGGDAIVLAHMRQISQFPDFGGVDGDWAAVRRLMRVYPRSPYLRLARLEDLERLATSPLPRDANHDAATHRCRGIVEGVLSFEDWGPFRPEAVRLAERFAGCAEDETLSSRLRNELK